MEPIKQTIFGKPNGNCLAACVASIFEVDLEEVPNFGEWKSYWIDELRKYCIEKHNMYPLILQPMTYDGKEKVKYPGYYIASGPAARGLLHSVILFDGKLAHDPHPDNSGIKSVNDLIVFLALDPAGNKEGEES